MKYSGLYNANLLSSASSHSISCIDPVPGTFQRSSAPSEKNNAEVGEEGEKEIDSNEEEQRGK